MSVLASLFMAGCSQEEIAPDEKDVGNGKANTSYMAVNLVSSDVTGTRATGGDYVDGDEIENHVEKVRFYFFNSVGGSVNVKLLNGTYVNFYDWTPENQSTGAAGDVEKKLSATIVINTGTGDKLPQMVAAVINPTLLDNSSRSLTQLKTHSEDYAASRLTEKGKFVMYNSIFKGENGDGAVAITSGNLQKTEEIAKAHPVTIYVERSVAKVEVALGDDVKTAGTDKLALKDKDGNELKIVVEGTEEQVYLKLEDWSLTADTDKGRLVKDINPEWPGTWWNSTHRSFWAINYLKAKNRYHKYTDIVGTSFDSTKALYTNENAQKDGINADTEKGEAQNNTKVILKGYLCDKNDAPFTIVRHLGSRFADTFSKTESANLPELKKNIISQLSGNITYYFETEEAGTRTRTLISPSDLKIVIVNQEPSEPNDGKARNCYVYAQLTDAAKAKTWYTSSDMTVMTTATAGEINTNLKDNVDKALVWRSGMTYYYYDIKHLNDEPGVVRNHVYRTKVTKIAGLGTPVYDPDQVIYPEKPDPNDHFIAAQIDILSWRIVESSYELEW